MVNISRILAMFVAFTAICAAARNAAAAETPSINVQANAPGWITVSYSHSGLGGVLWYLIQRQGGGGGSTFNLPNGQFTDTNLTPDTAYTYRVCAVYEASPACSSWTTARTLPLPGRPASFAPPTITDFTASEHEVKVSWGLTGDYSKILVRLSDTLGNVDQRDVKNVANASYMFVGLRSGERYRIVLKGCSKSIIGSTCGEWSPDVFVTTAAPAEEPPPPSDPTLKVTSASGGAALLEFKVMVARSNSQDRFLIFRDRKEIKAVASHVAGDAFGGSYTDALPSLSVQYGYRVCFEGHSPVARTCSGVVAGPAPTVEVERRPHGLDPSELVPPSGDRDANRHGLGTITSNACASGFVWRVARDEDLVCVTPDARRRIARENADAANHVDPGGANGQNSCVSGYVWRDAFDGDAVCVTPDARRLARQENKAGALHRADATPNPIDQDYRPPH